MALGDPYASPAELAHRTGKDDDGSYSRLLDAASRDLEQWAGRQFNRSDVATARTFRPTDTGLTLVDDFWSTSGLIVATDDNNDGSYSATWAATDYELHPVNSVDYGWPFYGLQIVGTRRFTNRLRSTVRVTAKWGWSTVPAAIKEATLAGAEALIGKEPGMVASESMDGYSVTYQFTSGPFSIARRYRRLTGFA